MPDYGSAGRFTLSDQDGREFTEKNLEGRPWIINFIFTRCSGPCPVLTRNFVQLQNKLPSKAGLLTITVDPEHDTPQILKEYAERSGADPSRWTFLTGPKDKVYALIRDNLLNAAISNDNAKGVGESFIHSQRFVLLDGAGHMRGFYDGESDEALNQIRRDVRFCSKYSKLPELNASLNLMSAFFLLAGFFFVRRKRILAHRVSMVLAFSSSSAFLASYLFYHYHSGSMPFLGTGGIRTLYFTILLSHTVLAGFVLPLALVTLSRALKGSIDAHKRIARWTFPIWLYVSVTGVIVYYMLYRI